MISLVKFINKYFNKKFKHIVLNKFFQLVKIFLMSDIFLLADFHDEMYLKKLDVLNKITENIFVKNKGKIKMEKYMFELVEEYNNISVRKKKIKNEKDKCEDNSDTDSFSDNSSH